MSDAKIPLADFSAGLQTTHSEDGLPFGWWSEFQNLLLTESPKAKRRPGMQRLFQVTNAGTCFDLNGTTQIVTVPLNIVMHTLRKEWTVDILFQPDQVSSAATLLGWVSASTWPIRIQTTSAGKVEAKVTDSASTVTTMTGTTTLVVGTNYHVRVVRNGTALTVYLNGVSEATGTIADLDCLAPGGNLTFGAANGAAFFDGKVDYCTAYSSAITNMTDIYIRCILPRAPHVLWHYVMEEIETTTHRVDDESRFENHGSVTNGTSTATSIARQTMPVTLIAPYIDKNNKQRAVVMAGRTIRLAEVGA